MAAGGWPGQVQWGVWLPMLWRDSLTPQLPLAVLPLIFISSSAAGGGALTQVCDVGPATWWRHDALGVPAGDIVVNLSSCGIKYEVDFQRLCLYSATIPSERIFLLEMYIVTPEKLKNGIVLLELRAVPLAS